MLTDDLTKQLIDKFSDLISMTAGTRSDIVRLSLAINANTNSRSKPIPGSSKDPPSPRVADAAGGGGGGGGIGGILSRVFGSFALKFAAILAPLTAFATILGSANSGFGVFMKSVSVFGATLAPLLLPVFVLLSAAVVTVSDYIWSALLPHLKDWMSFIIESAIPAIKSMAEAFLWATGKLRETGESLGEWVAKKLGLGEGKAGDLDTAKQERIAEENARKAREKAIAAGFSSEEADDYARFARHGGAAPRRVITGDGLTARGEIPREVIGPPRPTVVAPATAAPTPIGGPAGGLLDKFIGNLKDVALDLKSQNRKDVAFAEIASISRQIQQAGVNQESPLERKLTERFDKTITTLLEVVDGIRKIPVGAGP